MIEPIKINNPDGSLRLYAEMRQINEEMRKIALKEAIKEEDDKILKWVGLNSTKE